MMSFKEYWERNKPFFKLANVSKEIAYKIWCDSADNFEQLILNELRK